MNATFDLPLEGTAHARLLAEIVEEETALAIAATQVESLDGFIPLPEYLDRLHALRRARRLIAGETAAAWR